MRVDKKTVVLAVVVAVFVGGVFIFKRPTESPQMAGKDPAFQLAGHTSNDHKLPLATSPQAPSAEKSIPDRLKQILDPADGMPFLSRINALRALKGELAKDEVQAFFNYLLIPGSAAEPDRRYENWLRHEIMEKLVCQTKVPAGLAGVLAEVHQEPQQDIVMRDYALQHLGPLYERLDNQEQAQLRPVFWQAAAEKDSSIAGTALLALFDLSRSSSDFSRDKVQQVALRVAQDELSGELARITALQICGRMGVSAAEPIALRLAQEDQTTTLRISAIAALGGIGSSQARSFLENAALESDERVKVAAASALIRLNQRTGI